MAPLLVAALALQAPPVRVGDSRQLIEAVRAAKPGVTILLEPGTYRGGVHLVDLHGTRERPIIIAGAKPADPPRFVGGGSGMQISRVSHVELRDLSFKGATGNGLNIDDGGAVGRPSHHVVLRRIVVSDLPEGNNDGIKLSGLDDFRVQDCTVERWGGSAVDMVGCHRGVIEGCLFRNGGDSGVQAKGGTSDVRILDSRFVDAGQRGVNLGGSTGLEFFRPAITRMGTEKYEAKDLAVEGCTFVRGVAAVAFVGTDGATVRFNTIVDPVRWAFRILQETNAPGFVPCRNGVFANNLVVFSSGWASGGVNVGPGTLPETFRFASNHWFSRDRPERSRPGLPNPEAGGAYGTDPSVRIGVDGSVETRKPPAGAGAHAWPGR